MREGQPPERLESRLADPTKPLCIVESRSHPSPELELFLEDYTVTDRLRIGSSLKFCLLTEAAADIYPRLGPTYGVGCRGRGLRVPSLRCQRHVPS